MGLDGFSMANLGMYNRLTSAQMSNEVDAMLARGGENQIKEVDALGRRAGVARKDSDFKETGGQAFLHGHTDGDEPEEEDAIELPPPEVELDADDPMNSPNRFEIKINEQTGIVELYDHYFQMTVQKITTKELFSLTRKFNDTAGVLVNKKI